jgi:glc operon protein GlcG
MRIVIACGLLIGVTTLLPPAASAQFAEKKGVDPGGCAKGCRGCGSGGRARSRAGAVAVVDDGGWPILIERMDHAAYLASVELAPGKARTAALFKKQS